MNRRGFLKASLVGALASTPIGKAMAAVPVTAKLIGTASSSSFSVAISTTSAVQAYIEYGYSKNSIAGKTTVYKISKGSTQSISIANLKPNSLVYYKVKYRPAAGARRQRARGVSQRSAPRRAAAQHGAALARAAQAAAARSAQPSLTARARARQLRPPARRGPAARSARASLTARPAHDSCARRRVAAAGVLRALQVRLHVQARGLLFLPPLRRARCGSALCFALAPFAAAAADGSQRARKRSHLLHRATFVLASADALAFAFAKGRAMDLGGGGAARSNPALGDGERPRSCTQRCALTRSLGVQTASTCRTRPSAARKKRSLRRCWTSKKPPRQRCCCERGCEGWAETHSRCARRTPGIPRTATAAAAKATSTVRLSACAGAALHGADAARAACTAAMCAELGVCGCTLEDSDIQASCCAGLTFSH